MSASPGIPAPSARTLPAAPARAGFAVGLILLLLPLAGATPAWGRGAPGNPTPASKRPSLILITVEGLRPDYLSCYGGKGAPSTPAVDRLSADGHLFEKVLATSPSTVPAVASLLTGLYPFQSQVWDDVFRNRLGEKTETIAGLLKKSGYHTAAFIGTSVLASDRGFNRGFDLYQDGYVPPPSGAWRLRARMGTSLVPAVKSWVEGAGPGPFFLWVHFIDPSVPGAPTGALPAYSDPEPYIRRVKALDESLAALFQFLRERGLYDPSIIVLTADHGLALGEHGEARAGVFLYDSTLRVPLIIKRPLPDSSKGGRSAKLAGQVDLLPTLEPLLGLPKTSGLPGRDLFSRAPGGSSAYYAEARMGMEIFGWSSLELAASGSRRLISGAATALYNLDSDPREEKDLRSAKPAETKRLEGLLLKMKAGGTAPPAHYLLDLKVPADLQRRLIAKGYAPPTTAEARKRALPDPRRFRTILPSLEEMQMWLQVSGRLMPEGPEEAILKGDPKGLFTLVSLGQNHARTGAQDPGELKKAMSLLKTAQKNYPLEPEVYHQLSHLATDERRWDDAELFARVASSLKPLNPGEVLYDLACACARQGKKKEAVSRLREAIRSGFRDATHISQDPDLDSVKDDPAFESLLREEFPSRPTP